LHRLRPVELDAVDDDALVTESYQEVGRIDRRLDRLEDVLPVEDDLAVPEDAERRRKVLTLAGVRVEVVELDAVGGSGEFGWVHDAGRDRRNAGPFDPRPDKGLAHGGGLNRAAATGLHVRRPDRDG